MPGKLARWFFGTSKRAAEHRDHPVDAALTAAMHRLYDDGIEPMRTSTPDVRRWNRHGEMGVPLVSVYSCPFGQVVLDDVVAAWEQAVRDGHKMAQVAAKAVPYAG